MWLERLSGHSTPGVASSASGSPPPTNRAYSPAPPRRPSHLAPTSVPQRPGFSPRTSSLSLNSNDSTTSLLASSRKPNGSGLKQSVTVSDAPDPLKVLETLLGSDSIGATKSSKPVQGASKDGSGNASKDDDDGNLDFGGLCLRDLVANVEMVEIPVSTPQTVAECTYYSALPYSD